MEAIFKLEFDCGRMGSLSGIFVANTEDVKKLVESKREIYFGEVLGKHSEVYGSINENELILVTDEPEALAIFKKYKLHSGHNPFDYIHEG